MPKINTCIPKEIAQSLKMAVESGEVSIMKLSKMSTEDRRGVFLKYVKDADLAKKLNVGFEARMNSETAGILRKYVLREMSKTSPTVRKGLLEKIKNLDSKTEYAKLLEQREKLISNYDKLEDVPEKTLKALDDKISALEGSPLTTNLLNPVEGKAFLTDLAEQKVGAKLTREEAQDLFKYAQDVQDSKKVLTEAMVKGKVGMDDAVRNDFAIKEALLTKYSDNIFESRKATVSDDFKSGIQSAKNKQAAEAISRLSWAAWRLSTETLGGALKSSLAMLDIGFGGRQGIKTLLSGDIKLWSKEILWAAKNIPEAFVGAGADAKNVGKWLNISRETPLYDRELIELYKSDNYINGVYQQANNFYGMDILGRGEEALPPSFLEGVVGLGRLHKASSDLYNTAALRMRRQLADKWIEIAKADGIDVMDRVEATKLGEGLGSFTGRANLSFLEPAGNFLNLAVFSARLAKSITDTYWHAIRGVTTGADDKALRLVARQNGKVLAGISSIITGVYALSQIVGEDNLSIDLHPTSSTFGFIKVGNSKPVDVFGGNLSIARTVARLFNNTTYDPKLGVFKEQSWFENRTDEIGNFITGKKSPLIGFYADLINQEHFGGEPVTVSSMVENFLIPITWSNVGEQGFLKNDWPSALQVMLFEGTGFGVRDMKWNPSGDKWMSLKTTAPKKYWEAVSELNDEMDVFIKEWRSSSDYQGMTEEERTKFAEKALRKAKDSVIDDYSDFIPEESE